MLAAGWLASVALAVAACSSSSPSPNKIPGQCVLSSGTWYCGTGYGDIAQCPSSVGGGGGDGACDYDGGTCFDCLYSDSAGATCVCSVNDAGGHVWFCEPSGTGCHL